MRGAETEDKGARTSDLWIEIVCSLRTTHFVFHNQLEKPPSSLMMTVPLLMVPAAKVSGAPGVAPMPEYGAGSSGSVGRL